MFSVMQTMQGMLSVAWDLLCCGFADTGNQKLAWQVVALQCPQQSDPLASSTCPPRPSLLLPVLYRDKVHLLSDYAQQQPLADSEVLRQGGLALLPRSMSRQLQDNLPQLRHVVDVPRPCLADATPEAIDRWNWMVLTIMLGAAGLVRYLIDAYPDDLPEYDPL